MWFTDITPFYGHPPLALWLESLLFRLFGDHIAVEKGYSLSVILISAWLTVRVWLQCGGRRELGWLPLLLLVTVDQVASCAADNMLENTMMVFDLLAIMFILKARQNKYHTVWILLSGGMLCAAFLTKGFTGLYPLALPASLWVVKRETKAWQPLIDTALMSAVLVSVFAAILLLSQQAVDFFTTYMDIQVSQGIRSHVVDSRFFIVVKLFERAIVPILIAAVVITVGAVKARRSGTRVCSSAELQMAVAMALLVLAGTLPMMISLKQRSFYLLTVFPLLCISLALIMQQTVNGWFSVAKRGALVVVRIATALLATCVVVIAVHQSHSPAPRTYHPILINDMKLVIECVEPHSIVSVEQSMLKEYVLPAYYYRWGHINMNTELHDYALLKDECVEIWRQKYPDVEIKRVDIPTQNYHLYRVEPQHGKQ